MTLNPTVTWDNGTTSKVKQLSDHKVIRSVRRKLEVPTAPLEDTGVRSEDEVSDEECARLKRERVLLNESCTAKMLTHLRDSIHSDPDFVEHLVAGLITILKIPTKSNTADILTKPLSAEAHWRHMSSLLVNIYPEDEGR